MINVYVWMATTISRIQMSMYVRCVAQCCPSATCAQTTQSAYNAKQCTTNSITDRKYNANSATSTAKAAKELPATAHLATQ